jgi:iron(III) transport system permease protein
LLTVFIFFPVAKALIAAVFDTQGRFAPQLAVQRLLTEDIWGMGCLGGGTRCGVAINSALLATIVGVLSTLIGLIFALVVQRGGRRYSGVLKLMSILPIVTPPFVIALALVVLFGRTGLVTGWLDAWFGIARSRWLYGTARRDAGAAPHVLADRVHDPVWRAHRESVPRSKKRRRPCARGAAAYFAR